MGERGGSAGVPEAGANAKAPAVRARRGLLEGHKVLPPAKAGSSVQAGAAALGGAITRNATISTCKRGGEWVGVVQFLGAIGAGLGGQGRHHVQCPEQGVREGRRVNSATSVCEQGGEWAKRSARARRVVSELWDQRARAGRRVDEEISTWEKGGE